MLAKQRCRAAALLGALTLSALVLAMLQPTVAHSSSSSTSIEVDLERLVNAERRAHGVGPLRLDVRLVGSARDWSEHMRSQGRLSHDPNLGSSMPGSATTYAENVGRTQATTDVARRLHDLFMSSSQHRATLLNGRYTDAGIGIAVGGGYTYATQRFTAGAPAYVAAAVIPTADLAQELFGGGRATHAVIARDDVFADALAAGPLAGASGPVLLTPPGPVLHPNVRQALERTLPSNATVWIVGGTAAVPAGIQQELTAAGWDVKRVAGADRMETAARVSRSVVSRDGRPDVAMVATASDWPDAAAGGGFGASDGAPILLSQRDSVPSDTASALNDFRPRRTAALGGSGVLSDRLLRTLDAERVAGPTRQGTSSAIARELWGYTDSSPSTWIAVPGFGADAWTWALGAAPLAARNDAAILLVGDTLADDMRDYLRSLGYGNGNSARLLTHGPVPAGAAGELNRLLGN